MASEQKGISATLGELVDAEEALRRVCGQNSMKARTVYHLAKLARLVSAETRHFHEQRDALFTELGTERECRTPAERAKHGATVREIEPANIKAYQERIREVLAVPVQLEWGPVRSCDLPSATAADVLDLGPLCELVEPEA